VTSDDNLHNGGARNLQGKIICINTLNSTQTNIILFVCVDGPQSVKLHPSHPRIVENEGKSIPAIRCSADCNPPCSLQWKRTGVSSSTFVDVTTSVNGVLNFSRPLERRDDGDYRCVAKNPVSMGIGQSHDVRIVVKCELLKSIYNFFNSKPYSKHAALCSVCYDD